jgi:hypothetical protein
LALSNGNQADDQTGDSLMATQTNFFKLSSVDLLDIQEWQNEVSHIEDLGCYIATRQVML